jgi:hypothetical protein
MHSWLPWRYLLRRAARSRGFIDPFEFLARLRQFSQPSEVQEPIELIRAGVVFHARGLINTKVIQNNLDWVWPYWVARQFDPGDDSFLPRAFSFSHVNLTHRNWSAVGVPGMDTFPIVDPRGMVTPREDRWSLDWWFLPDDGEPFYPSRTKAAKQALSFERGLEVITEAGRDGVKLETRVWAEVAPDGKPLLKLLARIHTTHRGRLVLAVRPVNPEGVSFIDEIQRTTDGHLAVGSAPPISLEEAPAHWAFSTFADGDISARLRDSSEDSLDAVTHVKCAAGLATAGAIFPVIGDDSWREVRASMPLCGLKEAAPVTVSWDTALAGTPTLDVPQSDWIFLHQSALRTLVLLSPGEVYPGPYTYRRFWFRDACLIMNGLIAANLHERARRALEKFPARQRRDGYFHSQEGEWDANGQVLWIADRLERSTGTPLPGDLMRAFDHGAQWITRKRAQSKGARHAGLLPPGFSAEHLGPNDYYYWDDFWGIAGLKALAAMYERRGDIARAARCTSEATEFWFDVKNSLAALPPAVAKEGLPASPYRRMDAGAIGSLVADYPLRLDEAGPRNFLKTADWLWKNCRHNGGFFQDIIHSGVNAYLTLALAQTFLRHGDSRYLGLIESVAKQASPTGHWPEAIHPRTGGGCMGDGQHAWAASEWLLMMRALFVREENEYLVVGAGIPERWFGKSEHFSYGPTTTVWGLVKIGFTRRGGHWFVKIEGTWNGQPPRVRLEVPGFDFVWAQPTQWETPLTAKL